jgi:hypothetical protein
MKTRKRFLLIAILILLLLPTVVVQAQEDDPPPPLDDDYIDWLVMSAVNDNMMDGDGDEDRDNSDLSILKKVVDTYYAVRIKEVQDGGGNDAVEIYLRNHRDDLVRKLERRIQKNNEDKEWAFKLFALLFGGEENPEKKIEPAVPASSVMGGVDDLHELIVRDEEEKRKRTDPETHITHIICLGLLNAASADVAAAITNNNALTYTPLPALTNSAPPVSAPAAEVAPPSAPINAPSEQDQPVGNNEIFLKPIGFNNTGFDAVTVVVESYTPAEGYSPTISTASTVVTPGGNSSGYLNLPLGTYTFCYYWELDEDFNNDGMMDYHHKVSGPATLNVNSNDSPESAIRVTLNPDSNVSNPNGKCGENLTGNASNLTPEEAANEGSHIYAQTCSGTFWGTSCDGDGVEMISLDIKFSEGGLTGVFSEGESYVCSRIGVNQYSYVDDGSVSTITITASGFTIHIVAPDENWTTDAIFTHIRQ